jgi:HSP20 family molecular chaperone IbpA
MALRDADIWMWSEACAMLARAERLHNQFFELQRSARSPAWEPPVDMLETEEEVVVLAALPGVGPDRVQAVIEDGELVIVGVRQVPAELRQAAIHRLELPRGQFARRVPLPPGRYDAVRHAMVDGCLMIRLHKANR